MYFTYFEKTIEHVKEYNPDYILIKNLIELYNVVHKERIKKL
jgi:hypothetical protein